MARPEIHNKLTQVQRISRAYLMLNMIRALEKTSSTLSTKVGHVVLLMILLIPIDPHYFFISLGKGLHDASALGILLFLNYVGSVVDLTGKENFLSCTQPLGWRRPSFSFLSCRGEMPLNA
eukprot:1141079-Pelagomonas_calceolata.AAC.4